MQFNFDDEVKMSVRRLIGTISFADGVNRNTRRGMHKLANKFTANGKQVFLKPKQVQFLTMVLANAGNFLSQAVSKLKEDITKGEGGSTEGATTSEASKAKLDYLINDLGVVDRALAVVEKTIRHASR